MKKLIFLLPIILFAFVNVHVNKKTVYPGEEVVFTIEATGNNIKFPTINDIDGFPVQGTAISQNITILNGNMQKSVSKSYIFFPTKSVTIPSYNVEIDSKTYKTKPIKITVTKPKMTKNPNFKLKLSVDKTNAYIGEPIIFKIKFFQKEGTAPQSIEIQKPGFSDFFTKQISKKEYQKDNFNITEYSFLLIPQKKGVYHIGPIMAKIGYLAQDNTFNDPFFNMMTSTLKYTNIFSNELNLTVKAIPQNAIFGDFKAFFKADKTATNPNEPVKVNLIIKGCGDFYDLPDFKLNLSDATVYENSPQIKTYIQNNKLCGIYNKEFTILSNHNIEIDPITFKTFDGNNTKIIKTNKLLITVKHSNNASTITKLKTTPTVKEKIVYKNKTNYLLLIMTLIIGIIIGILSTFIFKLSFKEDDLIKKIKKANEKELFNLLLEFSNNPQIEKTLKDLEENIYNNKNNKINKKEIIKIIKKLKN